MTPKDSGRRPAGRGRAPTTKRPAGAQPPRRRAAGATGPGGAGKPGGPPPAPDGGALAWWRQAWVLPAGLLSLVALIVLALVLGRTSSVSGLPGNALRSPAPSAITDRMTSIPAEEFAAIGDGGVDQPLRPITGQQPLKGAGGRPLVLFVGADYCPFCAAERWSLVAALSRFGQVSGLQLTSSATNDTDPNTDTLELSHLTFSSDVLDVQAVELADRDGNPYQTPNADQGAVYAALGGGTIPFLDVGNVYLGATAGYDASILHGLTWDQIAGKLLDANDPVTKAIVGNANRITAAICRITQSRPAAVCQAAPIPRLMGQLPAS